jgi:hypothetical protein
MAPDGLEDLLKILLERDPIVRFQKATVDQPHLNYSDYLGVNPDYKPLKLDENNESNPKSSKPVHSNTSQIDRSKKYIPPIYNSIRQNPLFDIILDKLNPNRVIVNDFDMTEYVDENTAIKLTTTNPLFSEIDDSSDSQPSVSNDRIQYLRSLHSYPAIVIPTLSELCIKAIAEACVILTDATANAGGTRPEIPWMQV